MSKEKILEEYKNIFGKRKDITSFNDEYSREIVYLTKKQKKVSDFLSKAIDQTREETIRLEQERIYAYVEEILIGCDNKLLKDLSNIIFNKSN